GHCTVSPVIRPVQAASSRIWSRTSLRAARLPWTSPTAIVAMVTNDKEPMLVPTSNIGRRPPKNGGGRLHAVFGGVTLQRAACNPTLTGSTSPAHTSDSQLPHGPQSGAISRGSAEQDVKCSRFYERLLFRPTNAIIVLFYDAGSLLRICA